MTCTASVRRFFVLNLSSGLQDATRDALRLSQSAAQAVAAQVDTSAQQGTPVLLFNTLPDSNQRLAQVETRISNPQVVNAAGEVIAAEASGTSVKFVAEHSGFGYQTYWLREGGVVPEETELTGEFIFENAFYRAVVQPDGTISSLQVKPSGAELLAAPGNQLVGTDSTGTAPQ